MKVTEHIANRGNNPLISFEILPPVKGKTIDSIYNMLDPLMEYKPAFINVTYHRAEQIFKKRSDGSFDRVEIRKRPGTVGICAAIMNKYKVDAVPHLICGGFSTEETENALIDLHFLGINNVLALRGDAPSNEKSFLPHPDGHRYAKDLVKQIIGLNQGRYIEEDIIDGGKTNFCIGVAGYPEKHFESPNKDFDIHYLKEKIDIGAEYITTQMFFDNKKYYDFVASCKEAEINVPIIAGLKPITSTKQLNVLPSVFHIDIPGDLTKEILKCKTEKDADQVGAEWLIAQCKDLIANGAPVLHFYTLRKPKIVHQVVKAIL